MGSATWVLVVLAAVLIVVALVVFVSPLGRGGAAAGRTGAGTSGAPSATGSLARGFSYLHVSSRAPIRRGGVHQRLARAFARIDAVDPHAAPRRIGEALAQARLSDPPATRPAPSPGPWTTGTTERTGDVR